VPFALLPKLELSHLPLQHWRLPCFTSRLWVFVMVALLQLRLRSAPLRVAPFFFASWLRQLVDSQARARWWARDAEQPLVFSQLWLSFQRMPPSPLGREVFFTASSGKWYTHACFAAAQWPLSALFLGARSSEGISGCMARDQALRSAVQQHGRCSTWGD
jgi:hypothetical protein